MPFIKLENFSGIVPRTGAIQLPPNNAQIARNVRLSSQELRSWKKPLPEYTLGLQSVETIYKLYNEDSGEFVWLEWATDVDAVRAPINDDTDFRVYYTGDGEPKKSNWSLATASGLSAKPFPNKFLSLKVPAPLFPLSLSASGGSGSTETRAYVYTYVSTFGAVSEESAPSEANTVLCNETGATISITGFTWAATYSQTGTTITVTETAHTLFSGQVVYLEFTSGTATSGWYTVTVTGSDTYTVETATSATTSGNVTVLAKLPNGTYNVTHRRIYRTVVGATTVSYQLVDEIPLSTTTYSDVKEVVELGSLLQTQNWNPPPDDLKGLVAMPNGMLAAFRENEIWFCEPYHPHAWPDIYTLTTSFPIVGLGVYGTTLVVLTESEPFLITGSSPLAMSQSKISMTQPCVSKKSIASDQYGVMYASPNGVVSIGPDGTDVISWPLYTRTEWQLLNPATMKSLIYNNQYIGFYAVAEGTRAIVLTRADQPPLIELAFDAGAVFLDRTTADIFAASITDNVIYRLDADDVNPTFYEWKSKKFVVPTPINFAVYKIRANFGDITSIEDYNAVVNEITAANQQIWADTSKQVQEAFNDIEFNSFEVNGSLMQTIPRIGDPRSLNLIISADGNICYSSGVFSEEPVRLPAGKKCYTWEVELSGNIPVQNFVMATSVEELKGVID